MPRWGSFDLPDRLELGEGVGFFADETALGDWVSVVDLPLFVLFGTTGVGKTTSLEILRDLYADWRILPGRRFLTSRLVVEPQLSSGEASEGDLARLDRYRFVRSFRERFEGGMSTLLAGLAVDRQLWPGTLIFDGLRGRAEATHAIQRFPNARFLVLTCPDFVRLKRLLARDDPHDRSVTNQPALAMPETFSEIAPRELLGHFESREEAELLGSIREGRYGVADVRTKLDIIAQDLRTHDPSGTRKLLAAEGERRALIVDTARTFPEEIGRKIQNWIRKPGREGLGGGDPA